MAVSGVVVFMLLMAFVAAAPAIDMVEAAGRKDLTVGVALGTVKIKKVVVAGSGCPYETPLVTVSADNQAVTIPFYDYQVYVPAPIKDKEKACLVMVDLVYPPGWTYAMTKWTYQGWVELDPYVKAYQSAKYYFQGGKPMCELSGGFSGGKYGLTGRSYTFVDNCGAGVTYSPCGAVRGLNVLTRLWIDNSKNPKGEGVIKSEVMDGEVKSATLFICHLKWTYCY
ncbi:hypothetical protein CBR_g76151 [Chara braunii]|uniref:Uncharacterized protein n=1 Tax=Chara braunii TaxID=69332 RepID=A0A388JK20_CHABU|nr:hypothetical protein CBR_g76151 [Chara braunii]|eukprot:GBG42699.1 hypothetical protein CBR_g76151 [Chara braunii]